MTENRQNIDWELAAKILGGEADEIDHGLFEKWLNESSANREEWRKIKDSWKLGNESLILKSIDTSTAWHRVQGFTLKTPTSPKHHSAVSAKKWLPIAASIALLLGLIWWWLPDHKTTSSLIVSNSPREEMILNDGSRVTLNTGSKFICDQPFKKDQRVVELDGEGYFQIKGNREWPFIIHAGEVTIKVTGTRFNVRAYPNLNITEVAVIAGTVEVSADRDTPAQQLKAGQTALFDKITGELKIESTTDPNILAWLTGKISFYETPLSEVAKTLERIYNVTIQISDTTLYDEKLTARFSNNSLDFVLDVVCVTFNLNFKKEGNTIFLSEKEF
ncbi:FecR family protein [Thermophagus sp. OGC60D27]|uniref:FecR family protein n=1 Tax=Thermophagus sp. OGC60D27 TaxID=3458415 RepID=UPI0040376CCA